MLGGIADRQSLKLASINLSGLHSVRFRAASDGERGKIELRAGSPDGPLLASVNVSKTGGWEKWTELSAPLAAPHPRRTNIFVVFTNPGKSGLMNLDWIQFNVEGSS